MSILSKIGSAFRKKRSNSAIQGAVFAAAAPVGVRKDNGIYLGICCGIASSTPKKKSKKQLRREKAAKYLAKLERKRYEYQIGHVKEEG